MTIRKLLYYVTHWEAWHWFAKYIVISPAWIWFSLKARTLWFFTPANPTITFGGFAGETKSEVYNQLPAGTWPRSIFIKPNHPFAEVLREMDAHSLQYPIAVKPESGLMGFMFRKIDNSEQLKQYHQAMTVPYILQEFITYPVEVSVFYYRFPGQRKGTITGFIRKEYMRVCGDGVSTLWDLIKQYPRVQFRLEEMKAKHALHLDDVIPLGETYILSHALNLSRGGKLVSLEHEKDERLRKVFDDISHYSGFYYGRFDIRCASVEDLKANKNFSILEFNGCGAEPHHVYGNGFTFWQACSILIRHWHIMSRIARYNHRLGIPYWKHAEAYAFYRKAIRHFREIKKIDSNFELTLTPAARKRNTDKQHILVTESVA